MILEQGTVGKDKSKHMFTALVRSSPSSYFLLMIFQKKNRTGPRRIFGTVFEQFSYSLNLYG